MDQETKLLKNLIEKVIIPQYPEVKKVFHIRHGMNFRINEFYVVLLIDKIDNLQKIEEEIFTIFKMAGLDMPYEGRKTLVKVDFTY